MSTTGRIAFVGLYDETNYGDPIIGACTEWLCDRITGHKSAPHLRLALDYAERTTAPTIIDRLYGRLMRLAGFSHNPLLKTKIYRNAYHYYSTHLLDADKIIITGGGLLKYNVQFFGYSIKALLDVAAQRNIPVIINATGVEGYNARIYQCRYLRDLLHHPSLVQISTRDDLATLTEKYFNHHPSIPCSLVCDPAVWASETYGYSRNLQSDTIGIGIVRGSIFRDYGYDFSPQQLAGLYVDTIRILSEKGHRIALFTNGLQSDNQFAILVRNQLSTIHSINLPLHIPDSPEALVRIISDFKAIIAARLHAIIIAYSLNIPAVGLVWNPKLQFFGRNILRDNNFITPDHFLPHNVTEILHKAIVDGYDTFHRTIFRDTIQQSLRTFLTHDQPRSQNRFSERIPDIVGGDRPHV